ncbi:hypothetical protein J1F21_02115 [Aeromonas veronii]|uniref:hypothetical protein n=1 Tax=Aeromonas veronii TaxID=654 RepID=UPI001A8EF2ED|nr:hypothetical protein [Aeromonas veronii]MBO0397107.1 hypothetical protein [Aeromonas veronii]
MKKTLIALAVAGLSFNAMAVNVDKTDAADQAVQKFASELKVPATGLALSGIEVNSAVGFSLSTDAYIRLNFSDELEVTVDEAKSTGNKDWTVADAGKGYVILKNNGSGVAATDAIAIKLSTKVLSKKDVTVKYDLYETAGNAVAQTGSLKNRPAVNLLTFASVLKADAKAADKLRKIDVSSGSKTFVVETGGANPEKTDLVTLSLDQDATVLGATAKPFIGGADGIVGGANAADDIDLKAGGKWTVAGPFVVGTTVGATAITTTNAGKPIEVAGPTVTYTNQIGDAAKVLVEGSIDALWTPASGLASTYEFGTYKFDGAAKLVKNGAKAEVNMGLNPDGVYSQFVRISNKSAQTGAVFITVITDDGKSANFPLSAVANQPAALEAGASTTQLNLKDIFAAAAAKGLSLTGDKKVRLLVDAQIPSGELSVQSYTVSKDGNSFATMNAF